MKKTREKEPGVLAKYLLVLLSRNELRKFLDSVEGYAGIDLYRVYLKKIKEVAGTDDLARIDISNWREKYLAF